MRTQAVHILNEHEAESEPFVIAQPLEMTSAWGRQKRAWRDKIFKHEPRHNKKDNEDSCWNSQWNPVNWTTTTIEMVSAGLSFVFLWVALIFALIGKSNDKISLWQQTVAWGQQTDILYNETFKDQVFGLTLTAEDDKTGEKYTVAGDIIQYWGWQIPGLWVLVWIFFVSFVFQSWRYASDWEGEEPDASRWFEYALTSPFQVVIVGSLRSIGDETSLMGLAAAQAALVLIGYAVELDIYRCDDLQLKLKKGGIVKSPMFLWIFGVVVHGTIWYYLYNVIFKQKELFDYPNPDRSPPWSAIDWLFASQFFAFTSFGAVQGFQVFKFCLFDTVTDEEYWKSYTRWYSVLSVTAKFLLELFFLIVLNVMPAITINKTPPVYETCPTTNEFDTAPGSFFWNVYETITQGSGVYTCQH